MSRSKRERQRERKKRKRDKEAGRETLGDRAISKSLLQKGVLGEGMHHIECFIIAAAVVVIIISQW